MEGSFHGRNTVLVKDVEITDPHVCVVMKRPTVPMLVSRNAEKYPLRRGSLLPTGGKGPSREHRGHSGDPQVTLPRATAKFPCLIRDSAMVLSVCATSHQERKHLGQTV